MRRSLFVQFGVLISFVILVSVLKSWFSLSYWPFWVGGILGSLLPGVDHLIYVYFTAPQDLTSQRVKYTIAKRDFLGAVKLLYYSRAERVRLIFHTAYFQVIFLILTIFVFTSSRSLFGRGLVIGFSLQLLVDQLIGFLEQGGISSWFLDNTFISIKPLSFRNSVIFSSALFLILIFLSVFF